MPDARVDLGTAAYEMDTLPTELSRPDTCFDVSYGVYMILSSVKATKWPSFGKELLTRLTESSYCNLCVVI